MMEILCTKDYDMFKQCLDQRELTPETLAKVSKSMKRMGFKASKPIIVNSNMEVMDGQHRLRVARNLGLSVYYVIDDSVTMDEVRILASAQAKWSMDDYVSSHIRQGREDFKRLLDLKELSGLSWRSLTDSCFYDSAAWRDEIHTGKFNLSAIKEAEIVEFISKFEIFKPLCKHWQLRAFCVAASQMFAHPDYNHKKMLARLEWRSPMLIRCSLVSEYLQVFQNIYNYKVEEQNRVDFTRRPR